MDEQRSNERQECARGSVGIIECVCFFELSLWLSAVMCSLCLNNFDDDRGAGSAGKGKDVTEDSEDC